MIVDMHTHLSAGEHVAMKQLPFRAEQLISCMDGPHRVGGKTRRVDVALAQCHPSDTIYVDEIWEHHRYVAESVERYPDRLRGCMIVNPFLGIDASIRVLGELVDDWGFRAIKLHPTLHAYHIDAAVDLLRPLFEATCALGIPTIIHTGDPPHAEPIQVAPVIEAFPQNKIIIAHLGVQLVSYHHQAIELARRYPNVYLELGWGILPFVVQAIGAVGTDRLLHASDCPVLDMGNQLHNVSLASLAPPLGCNLADDELEGIMGDNGARLIGVSPS